MNGYEMRVKRKERNESVENGDQHHSKTQQIPSFKAKSYPNIKPTMILSSKDHRLQDERCRITAQGHQQTKQWEDRNYHGRDMHD